MHFFRGGDGPHFSPPLPFRRARARAGQRRSPDPRGGRAVDLGAPARAMYVRAGAGVADMRARRRAQAHAPGRGRVRARWPPGARPPHRARTGAARLRMGGERECARTGDSNPGCNYPCIFSGEVICPISLLPSIFGGAERGACACWPARTGARRGVRGRTRWLARLHLRLSARPRIPLAATSPRFLPVCASLLAEFFNFLTDISV